MPKAQGQLNILHRFNTTAKEQFEGSKTNKREELFFVQGNFNPLSLLKSHSEYCIDFDHFLNNIKKLNNIERKGWICSLSHGVLPKTPEQNVHHFIDAIRTKFSTSS